MRSGEWTSEDTQFESKLLQCCERMLTERDEICRQIWVTEEKLWKVTCDNLETIQKY